MILVNLDVPDSMDVEATRAIVERWAQVLRYTALDSGVITGSAHAVMLPMETTQVIGALKQAAEVLK